MYKGQEHGRTQHDKEEQDEIGGYIELGKYARYTAEGSGKNEHTYKDTMDHIIVSVVHCVFRDIESVIQALI